MCLKYCNYSAINDTFSNTVIYKVRSKAKDNHVGVVVVPEAENNRTESVEKSLPIKIINILRDGGKRVFHPDVFGHLPLTATASDGRTVMTIRGGQEGCSDQWYFLSGTETHLHIKMTIRGGQGEGSSQWPCLFRNDVSEPG